MPVEWYLKSNEEEFGPFSSRQLKAMADEGRIAPDHLVKRGPDGAWTAACRVRGLFPSPDTGNEPTEAGPTEPATSHATPGQSAPPGAGIRLPDLAQARPLEQPPTAPAMPPPVAPPVDPTAAGGDFIPVARPATSSGFFPAGGDQPPAGHYPSQSGIPQAIPVPSSSPIAAGSRPAAAASGAAKRRRQQNAIIVAVTLLLMGVGAAAGIYVLATKPSGTSRPSADAGAPRVQQPRQKRPDVHIPEVDALLGEPASGDTSALPATAPDDWVNAAEDSAVVGDVSVTVAEARIGRAALTRGPDSKLLSPAGEEYLTITLELANHGEDAEVPYDGWATLSERVTLADDQRNPLSMKFFHTAAVLGQKKRASVAPSEAVEDVLLFDSPSENAEHLRLELPAAAFGGRGTVKFRIPADMVIRGGPDAVAAVPEEDMGDLHAPGRDDEVPVSAGRPVPEVDRAIAEIAKEHEAAGEPSAVPSADRGMDQGGGTEEEPQHGPIDIPGIPSGDVPGEDGEEVESFEDNPELMEAAEQLKRKQAEEREKRRQQGAVRDRRRD